MKTTDPSCCQCSTSADIQELWSRFYFQHFTAKLGCSITTSGHEHTRGLTRVSSLGRSAVSLCSQQQQLSAPVRAAVVFRSHITSVSSFIPLNQGADSIQTLPTQTRPHHHRWAHMSEMSSSGVHVNMHIHHKPARPHCGWVMRRTPPPDTSTPPSSCWGPFFKAKSFFFLVKGAKPEPNQLTSGYRCSLVLRLCSNYETDWICSYSKAEKNKPHHAKLSLSPAQIHLDVWRVCNVCFFDSSLKKMTSDLQKSMAPTLWLAAMSLSCMERQEHAGL